MLKIIFVMICMTFYIGILQAQEVKTQKNANDVECSSNGDLEIKRFKDKKKNDKVVIGREIKYKAKPTDGTDWTWQLGKGEGLEYESKWIVEPHPFGTHSANGSGIVKENVVNMPMANGDFGESTGKVRVTRLINGETDPAYKDVKVFFNKDEMNVHEPSEPNWYYYWTQLIEPDLNMDGINLYNEDTGAFDILESVSLVPSYSNTDRYHWPGVPPPGESVSWTDASTSCKDPIRHGNFSVIFLPDGVEALALSSTSIPYRLTIGEPSSKYSPRTGDRGIYHFTSVLEHEYEHCRLFFELWKDGYRKDWDIDDDGYPDAWEMEPAQVDIGFSVGPEDSKNDAYGEYDPNHVETMEDCMNYVGPSGERHTAGTCYEEVRCWNVQNTTDEMRFKEDDWSMDPGNNFQGKNW